MDRREFLKSAGMSAAALAAARLATGDEPSESSRGPVRAVPGKVPRRRYGPEGVEISVIGLGGIVIMDAEQSHADRVVAEAVERGVNYFDVAPVYGESELRMGPALQPYRKQCFLACKTILRDAEGAAMELDRSLRRLKTDYLDLYQIHGLIDMAEDVDAVFAKGGAMEVLVEAKRSGRVRHLGFSAHTVEAALAAMDRYDFDSILFPVNFACLMKGGFGGPVVEAARKKGVSILGLKAMARRPWPDGDPERDEYPKCWYQPFTDRGLAALALRWALSQPLTATLPPGEEALFRMAVDIASGLTPIREDEEQELRAVANDLTPIFEA